jgi:DNA-binding NarL/FixJ family response regulator
MQTTKAGSEWATVYNGSAASLPAAAVLAAMLDALPMGMALCSPEGRVLFANEAARREFVSERALMLTAERLLIAKTAAAQSCLRKAVSAAMQQRRHQVIDASGADSRLIVAVMPVPASAGEAMGALLMFSRSVLCSESAVQLVGQLYGLTASEREVLGALLGGRTVRQVANSRGRGLCTLRAQVGAIRSKFGQQRIEDVVRQVALMPWPLERVHAQITIAPDLAGSSVAAAQN